MRNTQTGLFSGLFVIIGHNLVICTEIWSILQRTAEHFCSYCHGEKSIETDEPIVKPQNWNSKFIISISRVTVKCIFILPCHFVIFMQWHFIVFLMLFVFWSYSVYCLVKQDNIFSTQHNITFIFTRYYDILSQHKWHIFVEHWRSFL